LADIYLDHNATTPLSDAARGAISAWLEAAAGNPSSVHLRGQRARAAVEHAREQVAAAIGATPAEVVFTSGATEANALACHLVRATSKPGRVVTTAVEHPSLLAAAAPTGGWTRVLAAPDAVGRIDPGDLAALAESPKTRLVSAIAANNETGATLDPTRVARIAAEAGTGTDGCPRSHTDATQALGKLAVDVGAWGVDLASFSAHKIGGLPGSGALFVRRGTAAEALVAGHQEHGLRGGTENVLGIVAFGAAAAALPARLARVDDVRTPRARLRAGLLTIAGARTHGPADAAHETGNVLNVAFEGVSGADLVMALDVEGIAVSAGAACASGTIEPSHVLRAMAGADAEGAVRMSLGPANAAEEIERTIAITAAVVARIRGLQ